MNQSPDLFSFYNTTNSSGKELEKAEEKAYSQEEIVMALFKHLNIGLTALDVANKTGMHESSARRSVTNLTKKGLLIKTDIQKLGKYGKKNFIYKLK